MNTIDSSQPTDIIAAKNPELEAVSSLLQDYIKESLSLNTRRAYASDWLIFKSWCINNRFNPLPSSVDTLTLFMTAESGSGVAPVTIHRRLAAIRYVHEAKGFESPTKAKIVSVVMKGIKKQRKRAAQPKAPATVDVIEKMIAACGNDIFGIRDKAILLLGFSGAFRRSELCGLEVADLEETVEGLRVHIRESKTDQEAQGQVVAIPCGERFKIVDSLFEWLSVAGIKEGPIFRSIKKGGNIIGDSMKPLAIAQIVKKYALEIGLDPTQFAAHSLRSGFLTTAAENNASIFKMMEVSRHKKLDTLQVYIKKANLFKDHAGDGFL